MQALRVVGVRAGVGVALHVPCHDLFVGRYSGMYRIQILSGVLMKY